MKIIAKVKEDTTDPIPATKNQINPHDTPIIQGITDPIVQSTPPSPSREADIANIPDNRPETVMGTAPAPNNLDSMKSGPTPAFMGHPTGQEQFVKNAIAKGFLKVGEPCSAELKSCVDALIADGKPEDSAWAICRSKVGEANEPTRGYDMTGSPKTDTAMPHPDNHVGPSSSTKIDRHLEQPAGAPSSLPHTPSLHSTVTGTAPVESLPSLEERRATINAQLKAASAEEKALKWEQNFNELYPKHQQLIGQNIEQTKTIQSLNNSKDEAMRELHNTQVERDKWHDKYDHEIALREEYRQQVETWKETNSRLTKKYEDALALNLQFSNKLTKANEEYLEIAKKLEATDDKLSLARKEAKKIVRIKA